MTVNTVFFSSSLAAAVSVSDCRAQRLFSWELGLMVAEPILLMRGLGTA